MNKKRVVILLVVFVVIVLGAGLCTSLPSLVEVIKRMHGG
ncbi:hypothetical protein TFLX_04742 [Thermoflexales bacterium]|nr:hypothetical protein TFLX_04742 [Thermoflexales bacterium]